MTSTLDGVRGQCHALAALYPRGKEAVWASELVWIQRLEEKYFASARDRTLIAKLSSL
jgi:hypothetical protein